MWAKLWKREGGPWQAWEVGIESSKKGEKEGIGIMDEIMFYERKGEGNKVGKCLRELRWVSPPKIDRRDRLQWKNCIIH